MLTIAIDLINARLLQSVIPSLPNVVFPVLREKYSDRLVTNKYH